jgi:hypothetical protein
MFIKPVLRSSRVYPLFTLCRSLFVNTYIGGTLYRKSIFQKKKKNVYKRIVLHIHTGSISCRNSICPKHCLQKGLPLKFYTGVLQGASVYAQNTLYIDTYSAMFIQVDFRKCISLNIPYIDASLYMFIEATIRAVNSYVQKTVYKDASVCMIIRE